MSLVVAERSPAKSAGDVLTRGFWRENPVLVQTLGLCSALAVTNAVAQGIAMGLATTFVLIGSSIIVSALRRQIPHQIRITSYILIIATFVAVADMLLEAIVPDVHRAMGPYIALVVTNCIVLGRQEAFASRNGIGRSILDAVGQGGGFTIALLLMSIPRELLGSGSILGHQVMGASFQPWVVMVLPPGGFFMIGFWLMIMNWRELRKERAADAKDAELARIRRSAGRETEEAAA